MSSHFALKEFQKAIFDHAESEYPKECCGMILGELGQPGYSRMKIFRNVQDEYQKKDPRNFPRSSRNAYFLDPAELLALHKEIRARREEIRIIYHSHIDTGAYFSEEDKRVASPDGEPAYPGVDYLVLSVVAGKVLETELYRWQAKNFFPVKKFFFD